MSFLNPLQRWISEPPPDYLFEISERGVSWAATRNPSAPRVQPVAEHALHVSPASANVLRADLFQALIPKNGNGHRRAALVIPDYAARLAVLDFEELPGDEEQRVALVRFRLRKSVPFPIDDARICLSVQVSSAVDKRIEVLAAAIAHPILDEYEGLLRGAGYQVGLVVPSGLAALSLCPQESAGLVLLAKASGSVLSVFLLEQRRVRLVRCIDFATEAEDTAGQTAGQTADHAPGRPANAAADHAAIVTSLQQTFAFAEDQLGEAVRRLILCGFGSATDELGKQLQREFGLAWTPLHSRFGAPSADNAGVLGLLEQFTV